MKKIIISLAITFCAGQIFGQNVEVLFDKKISDYKQNPNTHLIRCATDEYNNKLVRKYKLESKEEFEKWLAPKASQIKKSLAKNTSKVVVRIPVVVHVIHSGETISNNDRNITDTRVLSQITVLNQDFRRMIGTPGYNTNPVGADIEVEFCLATIDPLGNPSTGIDRVNLGNRVWNESNVQTILKPSTIWDPTKYFNIWVCQFGGDLSGVLGYAQFPLSSGLPGLDDPEITANTDGVIIDWKSFGSNDFAGADGLYTPNINKGRTTTHEIGHAFGLRHIWGDNNDCTVDAIDSFNDYCLDTPAQSIEHYDCNSVYDSCPNNPGNDMTENYMDYSNDTCMNIFTQDQKIRILTVLQNSPRRASLITSTVCDSQLSVNESGLSKDEINIYPNPVKDYLNIYSKKGLKIVRYSIFNAIGQEVLKKEVTSGVDLKIKKEKLGTGLFIITVYTENNYKTFKFLVE
ncbi:M43 family zinc metalloprotease [Chryseobacterium potabilaquae]|uniref:Por secretion system C-terminal sorting domain-containing protein n=1 Tax=Chryseobacterium potabilaquae TaxID=2675057 RepID=A0A6N4X9C1_9FLAO|nr:M43 family zinc metalloprotease [Chryseobacterium potabilaquae]CAA7196296.1 hypothetical protein CHRY9293_02402 [Chryseobacterium potabilaquae]